MTALLLLGALALGGEPPACGPPAALPDGRLSVTWVAPAGRRVMARTWLTVVPTAPLRAWAAAEQADVARLLQRLGLRRSARAPSRPWMVSVFEVDSAALCRPSDAPGVPGACARGSAGVPGRSHPCGHATDRLGEARGPDLFRTQWRDAAAAGFCVLPAERFLDAR